MASVRRYNTAPGHNRDGFLGWLFWIVTLVLCGGLAVAYQGEGLVLDSLILLALLIWHVSAQRRQ